MYALLLAFGLWKLENEICFQGSKWLGVQVLLRKCARMLRDWKLINRQEDAVVLEQWAEELERRSFLPPQLCRSPCQAQPCGSSSSSLQSFGVSGESNNSVGSYVLNVVDGLIHDSHGHAVHDVCLNGRFE
jgi:hypothetical protein